MMKFELRPGAKWRCMYGFESGWEEEIADISKASLLPEYVGLQ
jgi:hypothetical protein